MPLADERRLSANTVARSLLPLGGEAAPKRPAHSYRKTVAPPSESTPSRPESWALRRLVYSPSATRPPSYASLRHCLQLRQNPPACAPCRRALSFPCHCPSVVGLGGPVHERRNSPSIGLRCLWHWHSYVMAGCARIPSGMPGSFRSGPPTLCNPSPYLLGGRR